jgi:hypothetical protein
MELFSFPSFYSLFCYIILKNGPVNLHTLSIATKMGTSGQWQWSSIMLEE